MDSRLRVARGIAKTETAASQVVFETLKERGHPDAPPPTMSDGHDPRPVPWSRGYDPSSPVDQAILTTRRAVFPEHGLDPAH